MGRALTAPSLQDVRDAQARIADTVLRTPLVKLETDDADREIYLKLENLQPIGSFKLRGALNRMRSLSRDRLLDGVYTASAGNMAQGVAWAAREMNVAATVVVPDTAPRAKVDAVARLGARVVPVPYDEWWRTMRDFGRDDMKGTFVHPFADSDVMAGNGTIALEVLEDLPDVDTILVPWGGGGLTCGIAATAHAAGAKVRVYACEVAGAAPLAAALASGQPVPVTPGRSFVDGIGGRGVFPEVWELARPLIAGSLVSTVEQVADAVRVLARSARVVAEGAGAAPVAAARTQLASLASPAKRVVCIISGGNIDANVLATILSGAIPD